MVGLASKWIGLAPNVRNPGLFQIRSDFSAFGVGHYKTDKYEFNFDILDMSFYIIRGSLIKKRTTGTDFYRNI